MNPPAPRNRADRCPGLLRPWQADDGALVRLRLPGGRIRRRTLSALAELAEAFGDGWIYLTSRANVQVRGLDSDSGEVPAEFVEQVRALGLLPAPDHERIRNIMVSPLTGRSGGRADLWPVVERLDAGLIGAPEFAGLSGRFLFCLDDGRGDILARPVDLGLVAVDEGRAQLRYGSSGWGPIVPLDAAADELLAATRRFLRARGDGDDVCWHVDELPGETAVLGPVRPRDHRTELPEVRPEFGLVRQLDSRLTEHRRVPDGRLCGAQIDALPGTELVITPWRSILATDLEKAEDS